MNTASTIRQARQAERRARAEARRIATAQAEARRIAARRIVLTGKCPLCGSSLRRNPALTGWWQCEQSGAPAFRKHPDVPACSWQGFVE